MTPWLKFVQTNIFRNFTKYMYKYIRHTYLIIYKCCIRQKWKIVYDFPKLHFFCFYSYFSLCNNRCIVQISVNGTLFAKFKHRIKPEEITFMHLYGDVEPLKLEYSSKKVIIPPKGKKEIMP